MPATHFKKNSDPNKKDTLKKSLPELKHTPKAEVTKQENVSEQSRTTTGIDPGYGYGYVWTQTLK